MKTLHTILFTICTLSAFSTSYHVSTSGNDDNDGSLANPWRSIQHGMEEANPGSSVFIHAGMYNEALYLEVSGIEGSEIVFTNFENEEVIVDGKGFTSGSILEIYNKSYVSIQGLIFQNHQKSDAIGILVEGRCSGISIVNCTIRNINFSSDINATVSENTNAQPLIVYGSDSEKAIENLLIKGNKIYDCRTGFSEALAINGNVTGFRVENNEVYNISNIGIDIIGHEGTCDDPSKDQARNGLIKGNKTYNCQSPYATSAGIYVDGGASLIIENNEVFNNQWGIEIGCENVGKTAEDIIVRNNLVYGNQSAGLQIGGYDYPSGSGKVILSQILNNTFYGNNIESDGSGEIYLSYNEGLKVYNNIVAANNEDGTILSTEDLSVKSVNLDFQFNDWYNFKDGASGFFYFEGNDYNDLSAIQLSEVVFSSNLSTNPQFNSKTDFSLQATSMLIDRGLVDASLAIGNVAFDGAERIQGESIDIGAYEYGGPVSSIDGVLADIELSFYPNPASEFLCVQDELEQISAIGIFDILGREVLFTTNSDKQIDIGFLKNGTYIVNAFQGRKLISSKRLIVR